MLTPIDIQNHTLKTGVRGYSKKETDDFLEEILAGYEELYKENHELKEKISSLSDGIQYYKNMENTLQKTLVLAEKTSTETQEAAKSKADAMISEAQAKADAIKKEAEAYAEIAKSNANRELEATREHVRKLVQSYENYRLQFKKLAESQIEMLESEAYSIFAPELQEMLEDAPSADEAMDAEKTVGMNNEKPYGSDPVELTEEERLAETRDLSGLFGAQKDEEAVLASEKVISEVETDLEPDTEENMEQINTDVAAKEDEEETTTEVTKEEVTAEPEEETNDWSETTPKLEGYEHAEISKTVVPETEKEEKEEEETEEEEDSPFTFIDPE